MASTPFFVWVREILEEKLGIRQFSQHIWMGSWGAATPKPTTLLASASWVRQLHKPLTKEQREKFAENTKQLVVGAPCSRGSDKKRVTGSTGLKDSQVYPVGYGRAVQRVHSFASMSEEFLRTNDGIDLDIDWTEWLSARQRCHFEEARLNELAEFLQLPHDRFLL